MGGTLEIFRELDPEPLQFVSSVLFQGVSAVERHAVWSGTRHLSRPSSFLSPRGHREAYMFRLERLRFRNTDPKPYIDLKGPKPAGPPSATPPLVAMPNPRPCLVSFSGLGGGKCHVPHEVLGRFLCSYGIET